MLLSNLRKYDCKPRTSNPSLWSVITCLQKDNAIVETDVFRHTCGESIAGRVRKGTVVHQKRMAKVASGSMSVVDFLEAIGRSIRLHIWHSLHLTWVYICPCVNCFAYADIHDICNLLHFVNSMIDSIYIFVWIVASICLYLLLKLIACGVFHIVLLVRYFSKFK